MVKHLAIIISLFFFSNVYSQTKSGFRIGAKGAFNSTWILNKNIMDDPNVAYVASFGYNYGLGLGFNFIDRLGIYVDLQLNKHNQNYGDDGAGTDVLEKYNFKYTDLITTLRYTSELGFYLELGTNFSSLKNVKTSLAIYPTATNIIYKDVDVTKYFEKSNFGGVFGIGGEYDIIDNLYFTAGLRLCYGLTDIVSKEGGKGNNYSEDDPLTTKNEKVAYKPTNTAFGGLHVGIFYRFGK